MIIATIPVRIIGSEMLLSLLLSQLVRRCSCGNYLLSEAIKERKEKERLFLIHLILLLSIVITGGNEKELLQKHCDNG